MTNILLLQVNAVAINAVNSKIAQAYLITKTNFDNEVSSLDSNIAANKSKMSLLKMNYENLKIFSKESVLGLFPIFVTTSWFNGENGFQAYLIFQLVHKYIKIVNNTKYISEWKSIRLSDESIKPPTKSCSINWLLWLQNKRKI